MPEIIFPLHPLPYIVLLDIILTIFLVLSYIYIEHIKKAENFKLISYTRLNLGAKLGLIICLFELLFTKYEFAFTSLIVYGFLYLYFKNQINIRNQKEKNNI